MRALVRGLLAEPAHLEEMVAERGVRVDRATVCRWALKMLPVMAVVLRRRKHPVGAAWRVDETTCSWPVSGSTCTEQSTGSARPWTSYSRHRDVAAARRFFVRAIDLHDVPESITIDKSGANTAAVRGLIANSGADVVLWQSKYLNNVVEQDHRTVKRRVRPMMGFKSFWSAARLISGTGICQGFTKR